METTILETGACIDGPESGLGVATAEERALWAHFERTRFAGDRFDIARQLAPLIDERMGASEWFMPISSRAFPGMEVSRAAMLEEREERGALTEAERDELSEFRHGKAAERQQ